VGLKNITAKSRDDENQVLISIGENSTLTQRERAAQLGWRMSNGEPYRMRVRRAEAGLLKAKLISKGRSGWVITQTGTEELAKMTPASDPAKQGAEVSQNWRRHGGAARRSRPARH
jgi:hypothetical protein